MVVLDSDLLIGVLRGNKDAVNAFSTVDDKRTTVINIAEIFRGAYKAGVQKNFILVESFASSIEALSLTKLSASNCR